MGLHFSSACLRDYFLSILDYLSKITRILNTAGLAAVFFFTAMTMAPAAETSRVYVRFQRGQKNAVRALLQQAGGKVHHEFDGLNAVATTLPVAAIAGIRNNPNVVLVENDPPRQLLGCDMAIEAFPYGLTAVQATSVWDQDHNGVLDTGAPTGSGIKVGVIDSGVFAGHSDFAGVPMTGYPDDWNIDRLGHGTHVTGTIAAQINGSGVAGVSPGASIHMVKVFEYDELEGVVFWVYSSTLLDAAQKCQAAGCRIINMSLGGGEPSATEEDGLTQLYDAGVLLVAAAGNSGTNTVQYPAGYSSVISVAALDQNNVPATFSQRNNDVELAAPGSNVLSAVTYCERNSVSGNGFAYLGHSLQLAARAVATGILVDGGLGTSTNAAWAGKVVLVERGSITFHQKMMNVQNSGGLGCVIYNNVPGEFSGILADGPSFIPVIGISQEDGQALLPRIGQTVTVDTRILNEVSAWDYYNGTSMATPHVCAVAALLWSAAPTSSSAIIRQAMTSTALDLGVPGRDITTGYGLVRAKAALDWLASRPLISIRRTVTNTLAISWPSAATNYVLQQNTNGVTSPNWSNVTANIQNNGATKTLIVNPAGRNRFYRLVSP